MERPLWACSASGYWQSSRTIFTGNTRFTVSQSLPSTSYINRQKSPPDELLEIVKDQGIRTVIDLRTSDESPVDVALERAALLRSDAAFVHLPAAHVPADETVRRFLEIVGDPENRPVLVHCKHGTGRSVLFASLFRVEFENWDNEVARRAVEPLHWRGNFAPHAPKGKYLLAYQRHRWNVTLSSIAYDD